MKKLRSKTPDFSLTESEVNAWGCKPVSQKRLQDALELFRLNVYLYPESANTFDSLGEIYAEPGNKKPAVKHYRKSLKLNPQKKMPDSRSKICNRPIFRYRIKPVSENWNKNRNVLYIVNLHRRNFRWFFYDLKYDLKTDLSVQ